MGSSLPFATNLDFDLDASVYFLLAALVVDAELDDIAIFERKRPRFDVGVGQPHMVEECTRGGFGVFQEELDGVCNARPTEIGMRF